MMVISTGIFAKPRRYALVSTIAAMCLCGLPAFGGTVIFPSATSTIVDSGSDIATELEFFWSALRGDGITQTFTGTGISALTGLILDFDVDSHLGPGAEVDWNVLVNGIAVGNWSWTVADGSGTLNRSYLFAPIAGSGTYTIQMLVSNETPSGGGSIGILIPGTATLIGTGAVPEPASMLLLGTALAGLAVRRILPHRH